MGLWKNSDQANDAPAFIVQTGTLQTTNAVAGGNANPRYVSSYGNTNTGVFVNGMAVGTFGVDANQALAGRNSHNFGSVTPGWTRVVFGTGPVTGFSVTNTGSSFANGETISVTGGTQAAVGTVVTNSNGNMTSVTTTQAGYGFTNTASLTIAFNRQKHLTTITVAGTPTGYNNTDTISISNGIVNATATIVTNSTGGFATGNVTITNVGLFSNTASNSSLVFTVLAANGAASNGSGATLTGNLVSSTSGNVSVTLGGRSGRRIQEPLVTMKIMTNENPNNTIVFPNT